MKPEFEKFKEATKSWDFKWIYNQIDGDETKMDGWIRNLNLSQDALKGFLAQWDGVGDLTEEFTQYLGENKISLISWSDIASNAANILKSFGASLLSMGINMVVGMAIDGAITAITNYINRVEIAAQKTQ